MNAKRYVLNGFSLVPMVPVIFLWSLIGLVAGRFWRFEGGILRWTKRDWAERVWKWTTRVGFCELTGSEPGKTSERLEEHEGTHTRQFLDDCFRMAIVALVALVFGANPWACLCLYAFGPWLILTNMVTAWLRGWAPYMDSGHELDARACAAVTGHLRFRDYDARLRGVTRRGPF